MSWQWTGSSITDTGSTQFIYQVSQAQVSQKLVVPSLFIIHAIIKGGKRPKYLAIFC